MGIRLARARTGSWRLRPDESRGTDGTCPSATPASVSGGSFLAGCISGDHAVLRFGIWRIAVAAGTTQGEAVLWRDSETIAWCDWDVTATNRIAWQEMVQLARHRSIRKELSDD